MFFYWPYAEFHNFGQNHVMILGAATSFCDLPMIILGLGRANASDRL